MASIRLPSRFSSRVFLVPKMERRIRRIWIRMVGGLREKRASYTPAAAPAADACVSDRQIRAT
jgi:hypothetical protein